MNTTAKTALKIIPASLKTQPVFLRVDDTMVSRFDTKFENVSKLFDHFSYFNSKAYADSESPVGICIRFVLENYFTLYFTYLLFNSACCNTTLFEESLVSCLFRSRNFHGYLFGNSLKCRFSNCFQGFYLLHVDSF